MDFELSDEQRAIVDAVGQLLGRYAGAARAIELNRKGEIDRALDDALAELNALKKQLASRTN